MDLRWKLFIASALLALGVVSGLADVWVMAWQFASAGHPDIAVRGPFLVGLYLPAFVAGSYAVAVALAVWRRSPAQAGWGWTFLLPAIGTVLGMVVLLSGPAADLHRLLANSGGTALVAAVEILVIGGAVALIVSNDSEVAPQVRGE
jgi:hypothetical protein